MFDRSYPGYIESIPLCDHVYTQTQMVKATTAL